MPREIQAKPPFSAGVDYSSAAAEFAVGLSPIQEWTNYQRGLEPEFSADTDVNFNRLLDTVQSRLPGITLPLLELELWNVVDEFCLRSVYVRHRAWWRMEQGVNTIDFQPFSDKLDVAWVIEQFGLYRYAIDPPATLTDLEMPSAHRRGHVLLCLKPRDLNAVKRGAIPHVFRNFFEVMLDGVLFRLYGEPAKPWSNQQLAQYHGTRFKAGVNRARDIAERANGPGQSDFRRFPYFSMGRRKQ